MYGVDRKICHEGHWSASRGFFLFFNVQYCLQKMQMECQRVWTLIRLLLRSSLIWVNTVCSNLSEIFPTINKVPLHIAFHYHPTVILIWLKYCWNGHKIIIHPSNLSAQIHIFRVNPHEVKKLCNVITKQHSQPEQSSLLFFQRSENEWTMWTIMLISFCQCTLLLVIDLANFKKEWSISY